jgi:hypothetical protein
MELQLRPSVGSHRAQLLLPIATAGCCVGSQLPIRMWTCVFIQVADELHSRTDSAYRHLMSGPYVPVVCRDHAAAARPRAWPVQSVWISFVWTA